MTQPKFRVGQVVAIRSNGALLRERENLGRIAKFDGIFYSLLPEDGLNWRENELRPLTKRERGEEDK